MPDQILSGIAKKVKEILDPYDKTRTECDGFTRVATYLLTKAGIPHAVCTGQARWREDYLPLHFWIVLGDCTMVDYRLRMWFGEEAPHGVFVDKSVDYDGVSIEMPVDDFTFEILTRGM